MTPPTDRQVHVPAPLSRYRVTNLVSPWLCNTGALAGAVCHYVELASTAGSRGAEMDAEQVMDDLRVLVGRYPGQVARPRWLVLGGDHRCVSGDLLLMARLRLGCLIHVTTDGTPCVDTGTGIMPIHDHVTVRIAHTCPTSITTQIYHSVMAASTLPPTELVKLNTLLDRAAYNGPRYMELAAGAPTPAQLQALLTVGRTWQATRPMVIPKVQEVWGVRGPGWAAAQKAGA